MCLQADTKVLIIIGFCFWLHLNIAKRLQLLIAL